jgi:hypothetical protein
MLNFGVDITKFLILRPHSSDICCHASFTWPHTSESSVTIITLRTRVRRLAGSGLFLLTRPRSALGLSHYSFSRLAGTLRDKVARE